MKAHNLSKRLWLAVLITIFIFHSLPPLSIYAEGARPDISPAKGVAPMSEDRNGSLEFLPVETIAKISEALNKFIEQKNDTEANIGDTFKEAVNGKDILEEKGYILITNYKNLPEKLIRPDGTIVTYNY